MLKPKYNKDSQDKLYKKAVCFQNMYSFEKIVAKTIILMKQ